jgi:hypothetical protein
MNTTMQSPFTQVARRLASLVRSEVTSMEAMADAAYVTDEELAGEYERRALEGLGALAWHVMTELDAIIDRGGPVDEARQSAPDERLNDVLNKVDGCVLVAYTATAAVLLFADTLRSGGLPQAITPKAARNALVGFAGQVMDNLSEAERAVQAVA